MIIDEIHKETEEKEKFMKETTEKIKELHHTFNQLVIRSNIIRRGLQMIQEVEGEGEEDEEKKSNERNEDEDDIRYIDEGMKLMTGPRVSDKSNSF
jgi:hypothetical protein